MRVTSLMAGLLALVFTGAAAVTPVRAATGVVTATEAETPVDELDQAFTTLQTSPSPRIAKAAERRIIRMWLESGSDTVDLLMSWALKAMQEEDYGLALDYLDRIVVMRPEFAEGWNKRATVFFLTDDYAKALADIEQALIREPRHFGAMSGLGMILRELGEDERAIEVFTQALEIDPLLDNVREALDDLTADNAGADI